MAREIESECFDRHRHVLTFDVDLKFNLTLCLNFMSDQKNFPKNYTVTGTKSDMSLNNET